MFRKSFAAALALTGMATAPALAQPNVFFGVEPQLRTQQLNEVRTAIVAVVNAGDQTAENCSIRSRINSSSFDLDYFEITIENGSISGNGAQNAPFDVPAGETRYAAIALNLTADFMAPGIPVVTPQNLVCDNFTVEGLSRLNRLALSQVPAGSADVIAASATLSGDGVIRVATDGGVQRASIAMVNIGDTEQIVATPRFRRLGIGFPFDFRGGPFELLICETNPATGVCLAPPASSITFTLNETSRTAAIVLRDNLFYGSQLVPDQNRISVTFTDPNGYTVGETTLAYTTPAPPVVLADADAPAAVSDFAGIYTMRLNGNDGDLSTGSRDMADGFLVIFPDGETWFSSLYLRDAMAPGLGFLNGPTSLNHVARGTLELGGISNGTQAWSVALEGLGRTYESSELFTAALGGQAAPGYLAGSISLTSGDTSDYVLAEWPLPAGFRASFDALTLQPVGFSEVAGEFVSGTTIGDPSYPTPVRYLVEADGSVSGSFQSRGETCNFTGTLSSADPSRNFTRFNGTVTDCAMSGETRGLAIWSPDAELFTTTQENEALILRRDSLTILFQNIQTLDALYYQSYRASAVE